MDTKIETYAKQRKQIAVRMVALEAQRRRLAVVLAQRDAASNELPEAIVSHR